MIVADTNLIVHLFLEGEWTEDARGVLHRDAGWMAPVLWRSEFRNTLTTLIREEHLALRPAMIAASAAEGFLFENEFEIASPPVLELAQASGRSAYDCEFVALAQQHGVKLVTSDRRLLSSFPDVAVSPGDFVSHQA